MTHRLLYCGLVALALTGCGTSADLTDEHAAAISDSVATVMSDLRRFSAEAQWDSLLLLYADEPVFHWVEDGVMQYPTKNDIKAAIEAAPSGTRLVTTHRDLQVTPLAPGVASVFTLFETQFVDSSGTGFSFSGAITMVLAHREQGWQIVSGHSSTPSTWTR